MGIDKIPGSFQPENNPYQQPPQYDPFNNPNNPRITAIDLSEPQQAPFENTPTNYPATYVPPISQNYQPKYDSSQPNGMIPIQNPNQTGRNSDPVYQPNQIANQHINNPQFQNYPNPLYSPAPVNPNFNFQQPGPGHPHNYPPRPSYQNQNPGYQQFPNPPTQNFQYPKSPQFQK